MVKAVDTITGLKKPDPGNSCLSPARPDRRAVEIGPEPEKARLGPTGPARPRLKSLFLQARSDPTIGIKR